MPWCFCTPCTSSLKRLALTLLLASSLKTQPPGVGGVSAPVAPIPQHPPRSVFDICLYLSGLVPFCHYPPLAAAWSVTLQAVQLAFTSCFPSSKGNNR